MKIDRSSSKLKLFIVATLLLGVATFAAFGVYCAVIINELPPVFDQSVPRFFDRGHEALEGDENTIEQGVSLNKRTLKTYHLWGLSERPFESYLRELQGRGAIESPEKKTITTLEELELGPIYKNDCRTIYCYQKILPFSKIPGVLWKGLMGIEDYRYLDHGGIDFRSLLRAVWHDLRVMKLEQGGSTLTQQLVKNLYFTNERKFSRKVKEMIVSVYLEWKYSKEEILAAYFNEVEWGSIQSIRIKGIYAASLMYFDKKPSELSPYEVGILIGLLKGPYFYSPLKHEKRLKKRANIVFKKLQDLRLFSEVVDPWTDKQWSTWIKELKQRNKETDIRSIWRLSGLDQRSFSRFVLMESQNKILLGLKKRYPEADWASKVSIWKIKSGKTENIFNLYSKVERSTKKAIFEERHQVGSLLKPIIYGALSKMGLNLEDEIETKAITLKLKSGRWTPRESHRPSAEMTTYKNALLSSMNNPIVRAVQGVGFKEMEKELEGIIPRLLKPLDEYPAQILGSIELTLAEIAKMYSDFFIQSCTNEGYAKVVETLSDPRNTTVKYRVGESLGQMKFFGKTGTTNSGFDNWFLGFDGQELFVSWFGVEDHSTVKKSLKVYGSSTAFVLYRNFYEGRGKHFNEMECL